MSNVKYNVKSNVSNSPASSWALHHSSCKRSIVDTIDPPDINTEVPLMREYKFLMKDRRLLIFVMSQWLHCSRKPHINTPNYFIIMRLCLFNLDSYCLVVERDQEMQLFNFVNFQHTLCVLFSSFNDAHDSLCQSLQLSWCQETN